MKDTTNSTNQTADITAYGIKKRRQYQKQYMNNNPDKVKQWRINAIINAYKRLVKANPQYFIERNEINV